MNHVPKNLIANKTANKNGSKTGGIRKLHQSLALLALSFLTFACSHGLLVESDPDGAEIVINGKNVGQTPLELKADDLPPKGNLQLQVNKSGHGSVLTFLPNPIEVGVSQRVMVLIPKSEPELIKINRHVGMMIRAHQLYLQGRTYEAKVLVDEAMLENPSYIYPYLLKGAMLFLNQDFDQALVQYKKAEAIDPENADTKRLIALISQARDTKRMPAASVKGNPELELAAPPAVVSGSTSGNTGSGNK